MAASSGQKSNRHWTFKHYFHYSLFTFAMGLLAFLRGDAAGLIAIKVIFSPFFLLTLRAIPTFFKDPIIEPKFTVRALECHLLIAAAVAGFITIMEWNPTKNFDQILTSFGFAFIIMGAAQMFILWMGIRALNR